MNESSRDRKGLTDILRSEVTSRSVRDLLFWEIPSPFKKHEPASLDEVFGETPKAETESRDDQALLELQRELESTGQPMGSLLVDAGIISADDLARVTREQQRTGHSLPQILVNLRLVPAERIHETIRIFKQYIERRVTHSNLEDRLLEEGALTQERIREAIRMAHEQSLSFEQALLQGGFLSLEALGQVYEKHFDIKAVDLARSKPTKTSVDLVPLEFLRAGSLIPFRKRGNVLHVAMANPQNDGLLDKMRLMTSLEIKPYLAPQKDIAEALSRFEPKSDPKPSKPAAGPAARASETGASTPAEPTGARGAETLERTGQFESIEQVESESTVQLVSRIIEGAFKAKATDIHVEPQDKRLRVRYRIDGLLYDVMSIGSDSAAQTMSRLKVLSGMDITERRRPQDGHVKLAIEGEEYAMRASTLPTQFGEKMVLRLLYEGSVLLGLQNLGLEADDLQRFKSSIARPYGMVLATGPIGSGKTTTLYSALSEVNRTTSNIVTIEDPIEYQLPGINQVQVDAKIDLDFAMGLRAILRQDANVLMVGEIRDPETAKTAVRAATTGHLLFSTLHTNSAVGAITTLRHLGVLPFLIASSLVCVIAQRLVRVVCPNCCKKEIPSPGIRNELGLAAQSRRPVSVAVGCDACFHTGYVGRTGIYEVLAISSALREMIIDERPEAEIFQKAVEEGMTPLAEAGKKKILSGETTCEEFARILYV